MIRPANESDLRDVVSIENASFDHPWTMEGFRAFLDSPAVRFSVLDDGSVRGYVIYALICGEAEIYNIAVAPDYRRRGFGAALLDEALKSADAAFLDVREGNAPAIALYEGRGFEKAGVRKKYYENGDDAFLMKWSR